MKEIDIVEPFCSSKKTWLIWCERIFASFPSTCSSTSPSICNIRIAQAHDNSHRMRSRVHSADVAAQCGRGSRVAHNELITFCVISIPLISNASAETEAAGSLCRLRHDDTSGDSGVYCKCSRCGNWHNELALSDYTFNNWDDIVGNGLKAKLLHDNDNISLSTAVQLLVLDW